MGGFVFDIACNAIIAKESSKPLTLACDARHVPNFRRSFFSSPTSFLTFQRSLLLTVWVQQGGQNPLDFHVDGSSRMVLQDLSSVLHLVFSMFLRLLHSPHLLRLAVETPQYRRGYHKEGRTSW